VLRNNGEFSVNNYAYLSTVTESLAPSYEDGVDVTDGTRQSFSHDMGSALCERYERIFDWLF